jgi:CBS domain-containing protein
MNQNDSEQVLQERVEATVTAPDKRPSCVADVMTRSTITLSPHHSFSEAVTLMADRHFRHIVVVDTGGQVVGVISDRDILRGLARTPHWQSKDVSQIMTREPMTVKPETSLSVAVSKLLAKRINCLPVVTDDGRICGILTSTDLLKSYQKTLASSERTSSQSKSQEL